VADAALTAGAGLKQVQQCTLMSIKTGGCPEDCSYCSQSSKHRETTGLKATKLADFDEVYQARDGGCTMPARPERAPRAAPSVRRLPGEPCITFT
jgi:biotin synthase